MVDISNQFHDGSLSCVKKFFKFFAFFFVPLSAERSSRLFARPRSSFKIVRRLVRSAAATFEIRSNLFENVHKVFEDSSIFVAALPVRARR